MRMFCKSNILRLVLAVLVSLIVFQVYAQETVIRDADQLQGYLKKNPKTPLNYLSPDQKRKFIASLRFCSGGLSGFDYSSLLKLDTQQAFAILALFDAEGALLHIPHFRAPAAKNNLPVMQNVSLEALDGWYPDSYCSPGGCAYRIGDMCNPRSCGPPAAAKGLLSVLDKRN